MLISKPVHNGQTVGSIWTSKNKTIPFVNWTALTAQERVYDNMDFHRYLYTEIYKCICWGEKYFTYMFILEEVSPKSFSEYS